MEDYSQYFLKLDEIIKQKETIEEKQPEEPIEEKCCDKMEIKYDYIMAVKVCENCGVIQGEFDPTEPIYNEVLNPLYELSTTMSRVGGSKYRHLYRLHNWKNKDEIKEMNANSRYDEIKDLCNKYNTSPEITTAAIFFYKKIYISDNICSRGKIRMCNYIYCVYKAMVRYNHPICIFQLLKDNKLSIKNFNDSLKNIEGDTYIHKDIDKKREVLNKNYGLSISQNEFIIAYNKVLEVAKDMFKKINFNNIIIGTCIMLSPNKDIIKFCNVFSIKEKVYYYGLNLIPLGY